MICMSSGLNHFSPSMYLPFSKSKMSEPFICKGSRMDENVWNTISNVP